MAKSRRSRFGPGFLVTAAFIGPGTVTTCSLAGAGFGYALLYTILFAIITTIILQEMAGRLSLGSGKDLAEALRDYPDNELARLLFIIITFAAIIIGCGAYESGNIIGGSIGIEIITGIDQRIISFLIALCAMILLALGRYRLIEVILIGLVFTMSVAFIGTAVIVGPDIKAIFSGFVPTIPGKSLYLVIALIGTTVVPYNLFLHSSSVKKKWGNIKDLKELRTDLIVSVILGGIISGSIIVTSAVAFYPSGTGVTNGAQLAEQLKPLFGPVAEILFGIGFFAAGMSSAMTAPYATSLAAKGIFGWDEEKDRIKIKSIWFLIIIIGLVVSLFGLKPLMVIVFAQVANGLILPVSALFLLLVLNDKKLLGKYTNSKTQNSIGIIITIIVSCLGIWQIIKLLI